MKTVTKEEKSYCAKGYVLGTLWDGTEGLYPSITVEGDSIKDIEEKATLLLNENKLAGMGDFQKQKCALLELDIQSLIVYDGLAYQRSDYLLLDIGEYTKEEYQTLFREI